MNRFSYIPAIFILTCSFLSAKPLSELGTALDEYLQAPEMIIIRGKQDEAEDWARNIGALFAPRRLIFAIPEGADLPEGIASKQLKEATVAYVCKGTACSAPITSLKELAHAIRET